MNAKVERRLAKLDALEAGGVDNWEWYDESLKEWRKQNEFEEKIDDLIESMNDLLVAADVYQPAGPGCGYSITFNEDELRSHARRIFGAE